MQQFAFLAVTANEWTPEQAGRLIGAGLVLLLQLFGIVKCAHIMRRPTTNKLCVAALLLLLFGWLISSGGTFLGMIFADLPPLLKMAPPFVGVAIMLAAVVVGIIGLCTYDKTRYVQGRAQATWAVVLGGIMGLVMVVAFTIGFSRGLKHRGSAPDLTSSTVPSTILKPEFNFSISPPAGWIGLKPTAMHKLACVAMRRSNPETFMLVIGEQVAGEVDLGALAEVSKANLASASHVLEQKEENVTLQGLPFVHITSKVRNDSVGRVLDYEHWLATKRGFAWQIVFWGDPMNTTALAAQARRVMETFRVLDPAKSGGGTGNVADVSRPERGYATKIGGLGWNGWPDPTHLNALLDFGAQRVNEAIVVVPLRFDSDPPDLEALTRGLLQTLNLTYPSEGEYETRNWVPGHGGTGLELTTRMENEGNDFHYVLRVARGNRSAHLVAAWALDGKGDLELIRRSLDAITLGEPAGPAPPLTAAQKAAFGVLLNECGLSLYHRRDYAQAASLLERAFGQTKNDPTILENAGNALEQAEDHVRGRDLLAPHVLTFPMNFDLGVRHARLQILAGDAEAGCASLLSMIARGHKDKDDFLAALNLLEEGSHYPQALRYAEAWATKNPSANARRWLAETLFTAGKEKESIAMLEKLAAEHPKDLVIAHDLGSYYNATGENAKAAEVAEKLLSDGKESPGALKILGWSQMGRKWYRDAKATFERAAKKQPDDPAIEDAIRQASAMLGQGDNSSIREPLEMVAIPEQVAAAIKEQQLPAGFGEGHSSVWLMRATGWHFEKGKPLRKTLHRRVKVLSASGARDFSSVEIGFDPLGERIFMNRLEVTDAEGKPVAKGNIADAYVRDLDTAANHRKVLHMQVAGVQPGHVVEWEVTVEDRFDADTFDFQRCLFANTLPVATETFFVTGDTADIKAVVARDDDLKALKSDKWLAWAAGAQQALPDEPWSIWPERRCPMLWIGGEEGTWEKVGRDYLKQIDNLLLPEKSVADLSAKLCAGLAGDKDKIAAISRHVQKEYGYKAIEFGVRARRPNAAADTVKLRYGDCKDHALLLHQLLKAAGVKSHLALVDTNWRLQPALPSLDQFNHMVVHVPGLGEGWLVDATDKTLDLVRHPAHGLWHAHALLLDPAKPHLLPPPAAIPPGSCDVASRRSVTPVGNDWEVEETLTLQGYYAGSMRYAFTGLSGEEQSQKAQALLADQGAAQLGSFRFEHLNDPAQPAVLHLAYKVRNAISASGASVPALWEREYLETFFVKDRRTPFELLYPLHFTSDVTVKLPAAPVAESLEAMKQEGQSEFCSWKLESTGGSKASGREVGLRFEFTTKTGEHPADRYARSHDAWEAARSAWNRQVAWRSN